VDHHELRDLRVGRDCRSPTTLLSVSTLPDVAAGLGTVTIQSIFGSATQRVKAACQEGIDIYFENVGGPVSSGGAVLCEYLCAHSRLRDSAPQAEGA